jgi:hypothetical protein
VRFAGSAESSANTGNKMILVCFFDTQQRPSRNCILELSKEAQELKAKDAVVVVIQASKIGENELNEWLKTNNISFPVGRAFAAVANPDRPQAYCYRGGLWTRRT